MIGFELAWEISLPRTFFYLSLEYYHCSTKFSKTKFVSNRSRSLWAKVRQTNWNLWAFFFKLSWIWTSYGLEISVPAFTFKVLLMQFLLFVFQTYFSNCIHLYCVLYKLYSPVLCFQTYFLNCIHLYRVLRQIV